jgi:hypothetical protein
MVALLLLSDDDVSLPVMIKIASLIPGHFLQSLSATPEVFFPYQKDI